jgi:hypothetical protein
VGTRADSCRKKAFVSSQNLAVVRHSFKGGFRIPWISNASQTRSRVKRVMGQPASIMLEYF